MKPAIRSRSKYRGEQCLNCSTPLDIADTYCHYCGQLNTTKRLALKDFFSEFFANFISYDSRLWRTITDLILRPGFVTKAYCAGKRSKYANPFRFFLTVSIVFFLILQLSFQYSDSSAVSINPNRKTNSIFDVTVEGDSLQEEELLKLLKENRDSSIAGKSSIEKMLLKNAITQLEKDSISNAKKENYTTQKELDNNWLLASYFEQIESYSNYSDKHEDETPEEALKNLNHRVEPTNIARYKKAQNFNKIKDDPKEIVNILMPKVPLFLFFFAPVLSLFFWLLYVRGSWNYMEHMVFNFHLFTFIFLILYVIVLEKKLIGTSIIGYIFFGIAGPFYLYKAMRTFYAQGRFKTILKFLFINFVFFMLLTLFSSLFILGSIFVSV